MSKLSRKNEKGLTLMELLIYISISTIIVVVIMNFFTDVTINAAKVKITKEVQQNARLMLSRMTQEIRSAQAVDFALDKIIVTNQDGEEIIFNEETMNSLSSNRVLVTDLTFAQDSSTIFINLTVEQSRGKVNKEVTLSSAVVPRSDIY